MESIVIPPSPAARTPRWRGLIISLVAAAVIITSWVVKSRTGLPPSAAESAPPVTVSVVPVTREDLFRQRTISAEFRPRMEVELHAKVTGYLEQMKVDFGDHVSAGQLLATLEVPELYDQLRSAQALQARNEADYTNAHIIFERLQLVNREHPNLVAQQELDTALSRDAVAAAAIAAGKAEMERFQTMANYTRISAPFTGVITRRYADPGALIQAGTASSAQGGPLLRVSDNFHLRLDFQVSVDDVRFIQVGNPVEVRVDSLGGRRFTGAISRFSSKVNDETRTMMVELEIANPDLAIVPGMYAAVDLQLERHPGVLAVPIQAVGGDKHPMVYVVGAKSEIEARPVKLGLETPEKYEILSGLKEGEMVMIGNRSLVRAGQKVEAVPVKAPEKAAGE